MAERGPVDLTGVQHGVAAAADVDERGLHGGQDVLHPAEVDVADERGLRLAGDVVLDEHLVLEDTDLGELLALADHHDPVDGLAAGQELGLADDRRATSAGLATLAAALLLGLQAGRARQRGDLVLGGATAADPGDGVRLVVVGPALLAGTAATATATRAALALLAGVVGGLVGRGGGVLGGLVVVPTVALGVGPGPVAPLAAATASTAASAAGRTVAALIRLVVGLVGLVVVLALVLALGRGLVLGLGGLGGRGGVLVLGVRVDDLGLRDGGGDLRGRGLAGTSRDGRRGLGGLEERDHSPGGGVAGGVAGGAHGVAHRRLGRAGVGGDGRGLLGARAGPRLLGRLPGRTVGGTRGRRVGVGGPSGLGRVDGVDRLGGLDGSRGGLLGGALAGRRLAGRRLPGGGERLVRAAGRGGGSGLGGGLGGGLDSGVRAAVGRSGRGGLAGAGGLADRCLLGRRGRVGRGGRRLGGGDGRGLGGRGGDDLARRTGAGGLLHHRCGGGIGRLGRGRGRLGRAGALGHRGGRLAGARGGGLARGGLARGAGHGRRCRGAPGGALRAGLAGGAAVVVRVVVEHVALLAGTGLEVRSRVGAARPQGTSGRKAFVWRRHPPRVRHRVRAVTCRGRRAPVRTGGPIHVDRCHRPTGRVAVW